MYRFFEKKMSVVYQYSINSDFLNATQVSLSDLQIIINNNATIVVNPEYINQEGDDIINIVFPQDLTNTQKAELDSVVSSYTYIRHIDSFIFDAIVNVDNNNNYALLSEAILAGHKNIFVRNGLYIENQDIIIPNKVNVVGESRTNTIILLNGAYSIKLDATNGIKETSGTISYSNGSTLVTGLGTTFTNLSPSEFIKLGTKYYEILSIADDTNLTLVENYIGKSFSSVSYVAQPMFTGNRIQNVTITDSTSTGIICRGLRHFVFDSILLKNNNNFSIDDCEEGSLNQIISEFSYNKGIYLNNCISVNLKSIDICNNTNHGTEINNSINIMVTACNMSNNNGDGIFINGNSNDVGIMNCVFKNNIINGINIGSNANGVTIINCFLRYNSMNGIEISGHDNIISGNIIQSNDVDGIKILVGSTDNIINGNNLKFNGGTNLDDLGLRTTDVNNKIIQIP